MMLINVVIKLMINALEWNKSVSVESASFNFYVIMFWVLGSQPNRGRLEFDIARIRLMPESRDISIELRRRANDARVGYI